MMELVFWIAALFKAEAALASKAFRTFVRLNSQITENFNGFVVAIFLVLDIGVVLVARVVVELGDIAPGDFDALSIAIGAVAISFCAEALGDVLLEFIEILLQLLVVSMHVCQRIGRQRAIGKPLDGGADVLHGVACIQGPVDIVETMFGQIDIGITQWNRFVQACCRAAIRENEDN